MCVRSGAFVLGGGGGDDVFSSLGIDRSTQISPLCTLEFNRLQPRKRGGGGNQEGRPE